jgi:hypothetical protein
MNTYSNDRNGTATFAARTQRNLDFIVEAARRGSNEVHPITQTVGSLLGILVFPWQFDAFQTIKRTRLPILYSKGWPRWQVTSQNNTPSLGDFLDKLRNCIAHGDFGFSCDSPVLEEVTITFSEADWSAEIRADKLVEFCRLFTREIADRVS